MLFTMLYGATYVQCMCLTHTTYPELQLAVIIHTQCH